MASGVAGAVWPGDDDAGGAVEGRAVAVGASVICGDGLAAGVPDAEIEGLGGAIDGVEDAAA